MNNCCEKRKHRTEKDKKALLNRINRISGQLSGIKQMIEDDRYCIDVLNQISACKGALSSLADKMLEDHIRTCVTEGIQHGDTEIVNELTETIKKFI